jgi:hypothetical protein
MEDPQSSLKNMDNQINHALSKMDEQIRIANKHQNEILNEKLSNGNNNNNELMDQALAKANHISTQGDSLLVGFNKEMETKARDMVKSHHDKLKQMISSKSS